jgi:hypothetical protein
MAGEGYEVSPEVVAGHAGTVDQVAQLLGQAVSAAQQVSIGVGAYGVVCGPLFVPIVTAISAAGVGALSQAQSGLGTMVANLRATAQDYQSVESANVNTLGSVDGGQQ